MEIKKLKEVARKIAKFPNDKFVSNCISSKYMRLSFYIDARKITETEFMKKWVDARMTLKKLEAGEKIIWGAFS
jgi:hypothetical protein